jgi:hypothetical protein
MEITLSGNCGDYYQARFFPSMEPRNTCHPAKTVPSLVVAVGTEWPTVLELHSRRIISRFAGQTSAADVAGRSDWIGCSSAGTGREQKWTTSNRRQDKH